MRKTIQQPWFFLSLLIVVGAFLRFTNLFWGEPFWFHPDERNIASAVTRLQWPDKMNPEFFAYGTVPIYINFFAVKGAQLFLDSTEDPFSIAIKVGRIISALLSTALIPLMYWIGNRYFKRSQISTGFIVAILTTFTFGFIQFAHFGTFEIWLTILRLLLLVTAIEIARKQSWRWIVASGIILGLAVGTKITSLVLLPGIFLAILWKPVVLCFTFRNVFTSFCDKIFFNGMNLANSGIKFLTIILLASITFAISNPFVFNRNIAVTLEENQIKVSKYKVIPEISKLTINATNFQARKKRTKLISKTTINEIGDFRIFLNPAFIHSIDSEGGIARGNIPVFYTRHFTGTTPYLYQFQKIYPYVLSWSILIFGTIGLIWMGISFVLSSPRTMPSPRTVSSPRKWGSMSESNPQALDKQVNSLKGKQPWIPAFAGMTVIFFLLQFGFIGSLYVKWTRYTIPTLPYLILGFGVVASILFKCLYENCPDGYRGVMKQFRRSKHLNFLARLSGFSHPFRFFATIGIVLAILWHTVQGLLFFTIYLQSDPRVVANQWAIKNLSPNTKILSEVYDLGIIPFNYNFMRNITLFNFYELDNKSIRFKKQQELKQQLSQSNTIVLLSRRIWKHSADFPQYYPESANFYNQLFSGKLGFIKIAEFYNQPRFGSFKINDETKAEETFSVFDHPHIQIWQRRGKVNTSTFFNIF